MDSLLQVNPGTIIWTMINFGIFAFIIGKFGWKPIIAALSEREKSIHDAIVRAEEANVSAQKTLSDIDQRIRTSEVEAKKIVDDARNQAQGMMQTATEAADKIKHQKVAEAAAEIEREKESAMQTIRQEVAQLVVSSTEKILRKQLGSDQQKELLNTYLKDLN
jgi:F-type H+-transporting ATPase subunit b